MKIEINCYHTHASISSTIRALTDDELLASALSNMGAINTLDEVKLRGVTVETVETLGADLCLAREIMNAELARRGMPQIEVERSAGDEGKVQ